MAIENAYGLVIGIARYQHVNPLPPVKDAQDIYQLLTDPAHCAYRPENVLLLLDEQATAAAIRAALAHLAQYSDAGSTFFFYLSGHGVQIPSGPHAGEYLLPVDARYPPDEELAASAVPGAEFMRALNAIPARKVLVIFDCCHAGGIGQAKGLVPGTLKAGLSEAYYEALKAGRGRVIFASSRDSEYSYVMPGAEYGLFTEHLLAGLRGGAPGPGGVIRIFDLFDYVQPRVVADRPDQHPVFKAEVEENFPVALYLGGQAPNLPPPAPLGDGFAYDVFISYRQREPEKSWVRKVLVPKLEAEGIKTCIDYRDFRLGAALITEMQRAVEESRYSLAVLTPAYLQSNFAEFENILAQHVGLEQGQRRLLTVMRDECQPELRMRAQLWLDMTDDDEFDINVQRLIYELRQPSTK